MSPVDSDLLVPPGHLGFLASPVVVFLFGLLLPGLGLAWSLGRALTMRSWKNRADRAIAGEAGPLVAGPRVLVGEVLTEDGDSPEPGVAIKVSITQYVNGTTAREANRSVGAGPFYLRTESGEVVRIEPGPRPTLAAPLENEAANGRPGFLRYRAASLRSGERAICAGHLSRGFNPRAVGTYRAAEGGWVLAAGRGGNMWVSGAALGALFERKAKFFFAYLAAFAVLFLAAQAVFLPYYRAMVFGHTSKCTVEGVIQAGSKLRVGEPSGPHLHGYCDDGEPLSEAARPALVDFVEASEGVKVTRVRVGDSSMLGPVPTVSYLRVVALLVAMVVGLAIALGLAGRSSRSWFERRKVEESLVDVL